MLSNASTEFIMCASSILFASICGDRRHTSRKFRLAATYAMLVMARHTGTRPSKFTLAYTFDLDSACHHSSKLFLESECQHKPFPFRL
jgi:hypothetical protein